MISYRNMLRGIIRMERELKESPVDIDTLNAYEIEDYYYYLKDGCDHPGGTRQMEINNAF